MFLFATFVALAHIFKSNSCLIVSAAILRKMKKLKKKKKKKKKTEKRKNK